MNQLITIQHLEQQLHLLSELIATMQHKGISTHFLPFAINKESIFQRKLKDGKITDNGEFFNEVSAVYNTLYQEYRNYEQDICCKHEYGTINGVVCCKKCGKPL